MTGEPEHAQEDEQAERQGWRYAPGVRIIRTQRWPADIAPTRQSVEDIEAWLIDAAPSESDMTRLIAGFGWRAVAAGLPLMRLSLHAGTLHPQLTGFGWTWRSATGVIEVIQVLTSARETPAYRANPLFEVMERGREVRATPARALDRYPIMADLNAIGVTDYWMLPIGKTADRFDAMSLSTTAEGGFSEAEVAVLRRLISLLKLHLSRLLQLRVAVNVVDTYLGRAAGRRVLDGAIRRGSGERLSAVVWMFDLRGSTALADRLAPRDLLAVLDAVFEAVAGAVMGEGGEVLKFMGDGVLAVFEIDAGDPDGGRHAAEAALRAAARAQQSLAAINAEPPESLATVEGWRPLRGGVGLHAGDVFFGNIGAPDRLDFTVIGPAVNAASRVEGLCKTLGEPVLLTETVAGALGATKTLRGLGAHPLRGVDAPLEIYAPG